MSAIFLSTESQSPAAQMIIDCFIEIQQNMDIVSLDKYTDAISTISIIPFCVDEEFKNTFACKERKYIGWKRKEADIRLFIPFIPFVQTSKEEKLSICKEIIKKSLTEIHADAWLKKCDSILKHCCAIFFLVNDLYQMDVLEFQTTPIPSLSLL